MSVPIITPATTADALGYFSSVAEAASVLGVTQPAVSHWRTKGRLPTKRALQVRDLLKDQPGFDADAFTRLIEAEALAGRAA